jgi:hypothetical protein
MRACMSLDTRSGTRVYVTNLTLSIYIGTVEASSPMHLKLIVRMTQKEKERMTQGGKEQRRIEQSQEY